MPIATFLFDTYVVAERALDQAALNDAVCTAVRLGRHAPEEEHRAAFLAPVLRQIGLGPAVGHCPRHLREVLDACVQRSGEPYSTFVSRLTETYNLAAIRVVLAQFFQQEYGDGPATVADTRERRKAIRRLCRATPPEVWSDIVQGALKLEDTDFLAFPDFTVIPRIANPDRQVSTACP